MYYYLLQTHSILRYVVLALMLFVIIRYAIRHYQKSQFSHQDNRLGLYLVLSVHVQFVLGILLFFVSPVVQAALADMSATMKDSVLRFSIIEHPTLMLIAVILVTVGRIVSKRSKREAMKFRRALIYYAAALILIIAGVPWEKL